MPTASTPTEPAPRSMARLLTLTAAAGLVVCGLLPTLWQHEWAWVARFAVFSVLGLWLANSRWDGLKMIGVGTVMLLLANQVLSPFIMDWIRNTQLVTLSPGLNRQIRIVGDVMPGFPQGIQHITTDGKGFRTTLPIDYEHKPAGTLRVLAIGGSTTEQIYLDDRKTWTHLLQDGLTESFRRRVEVINTGVSGLRAVHHLATLRQTLRYQPDLVVILMGLNDWNQQVLDTMAADRHGIGHWWAAMNYAETALVFLSRQIQFLLRRSDSAEKPAAAGEVEEINGEYYSRQNDSLDRKPLRTFPGPIQVSAEFATAAKGLLAVCRQNRLRCIFLSQPNAYDPAIEPALRQRLWMTPPGDFTLPLEQMAALASAYNNYLMQDLRNQGAEVCDVAKALKPTTAFFYDDCHYNEAGARAVAQAVLSCVVAGGLQAPATAR
jgi:lysophospholipase L1-like esterase